MVTQVLTVLMREALPSAGACGAEGCGSGGAVCSRNKEMMMMMIRVISAVFLKDTIDAANNDAEHLVAERLRKKTKQYVKKLEAVFRAIDATGDGMITEDRLTDMLSNPLVSTYFQTLDVDVHESGALFHMLDNGDGEVTLDEFIDGIMRCKGPARAIEQVAMRADLKALDTKLSKVIKSLRAADIIKTKTPKFAQKKGLTLMLSERSQT
ncbi:unnamed protein product [Effrenium voratum]|uniref:EF-hand domain-containing protein n=1 Tax=Effrenium voratum TaxID=2562239 RepID=A0AA36MXF7_9DINO|nr:unnamed protein product [Effrenium voratum]